MKQANEPSKNCADAGIPRFQLHDGALVVDGLAGEPRLSLEVDVEGAEATEALKHGIPHGTLTVTYAGAPPVRARINGAVEKR